MKAEKRTALVIPVRGVENQHFSKNGECFVDFVTLTGDLQGKKREHVINKFRNNKHISDGHIQRLPSMTRFVVNVSEELEQCVGTYSNTFINVDYSETRPDYQIKIMFNPQKLGTYQWAFVEDLLSCCVGLSYSRIDIAFDYFEDLTRTEAFDYSGKKSFERYWQGGTSTGFSMGNRSSELYLRVYNKAQEMKSHRGKGDDETIQLLEKELAEIENNGGHYWRVEFELKKKSKGTKDIDEMGRLILEHLFIKTFDFSNGLTVEEQATLEAVINNRGLLSKMTDYTRRKYRKLLKSDITTERDLTSEIKERWENNKSKIQTELNDLISLGIDSRFI